MLISPRCTLASSCAYACANAYAYFTGMNQALRVRRKLDPLMDWSSLISEASPSVFSSSASPPPLVYSMMTMTGYSIQTLLVLA